MFITAGPITKLFAGGGGGEWTTCAMVDDLLQSCSEGMRGEKRPVVKLCSPYVCVFITADPGIDTATRGVLVGRETIALMPIEKYAPTTPHIDRESVLFIGTQFSILYTFVYSPA